MSRPPEEPRPPRRAKPAPRPPAEPESDLLGEAPSTWRPAAAAKPPSRPGKSSRRPAPEDDTSGPESDLVRPRPETARAARGGTRATRNLDEPRVERGGPTFFERLLFGRVSAGHLARFCRQASAYLEAGVDLIKALDNLRKQFAGTALGPVIERLSLAVRRGDSLGDAMTKEPEAFGPLFLSMIRVAEARGGVPETLRLMGEHYESRQRLVRQARGAMIYPAAVILIATAVGGLLTIFVLPKLVGIMEDMVRGRAVEIPWPTRVLMLLSGFIQNMGWWLLPALFFGGLVALFQAYKTRGGKAILDEVALYVPVLGMLLRKLDTARFSRTLASLLGAGVDFGESLDLTADVLHLTPWRNAVHRAREAVMDGSELSAALEATHRFPTDVISIVESGEETGRLPETLDKLADDYEEQVEHLVKNLGNLIQPILLVIIGGVVLFIALAFIMAYVSVIAGLASGA